MSAAIRSDESLHAWAMQNKVYIQKVVIVTAIVVIIGIGLLIGGTMASHTSSSHIAAYLQNTGSQESLPMGYVAHSLDGDFILTNYGWIALTDYTHAMSHLKMLLQIWQSLKIGGAVVLGTANAVALGALALHRHHWNRCQRQITDALYPL